MGNGSPARLGRTFCVATVAVLGLAAPAHAGDLLAAPAATELTPAVAAVAPATELLAAPALPAVEAPTTQPEVPSHPAARDVSRSLAANDVSDSLPQVSQLLPRTDVAAGNPGTRTLRPGSPHRAKVAAAPRRRGSAQPPVRIVDKRFAAPRSTGAQAPTTTVVDRLETAAPQAASPEPAAGGNPGEPAAAGSAGGAGVVGALLLATIALGLLQLGLRLVPAVVRPHGFVFPLQLERPG
jgi:hypothetical protein